MMARCMEMNWVVPNQVVVYDKNLVQMNQMVVPNMSPNGYEKAIIEKMKSEYCYIFISSKKCLLL